MRKSTIALHTRATAATRQAADRLGEHRERGSITVEHVMWAVIIVALVGTVGGLLTAWATGKINSLGG